jgi:glutaminyl-tRNA synthetase
VKLTVTNYPGTERDLRGGEQSRSTRRQGTHAVTFSRHLFIEADDFLEAGAQVQAPVSPAPECRLKGAYLVTCTGCVKDAEGRVTEVLCTYDPDSRGGDPADGRKVKGATLHWVDAATALDAEVRLYDNLFSDADPDGPEKNFLDYLNPASLETLTGCKVEADLAGVRAPPAYQFMRLGYFCPDSADSGRTAWCSTAASP